MWGPQAPTPQQQLAPRPAPRRRCPGTARNAFAGPAWTASYWGRSASTRTPWSTRTPPHATPTARACRWRWRCQLGVDVGAGLLGDLLLRRRRGRLAPRAAAVAAATLVHMGHRWRCCDDSASDDENPP
jgi:hypothetical protein